MSHLIITLIKTYFMNISIGMAYLRINQGKNVNKDKIMILFILNIFISVIYSLIYEKLYVFFPTLYMNIICNFMALAIYILVIKRLNKNVIMTMLLAICVAFLSYYLSCACTYLITHLLFKNKLENSILEFLIAGIIQFQIIQFFFNIKRFKDGISFSNDNHLYKNRAMIIAVILTILICIIFRFSKGILLTNLMFWFIIIGGIITFCLIKKSITNYYKAKLKDQTVELLNNKISEQEKEITDLKNELKAILTINHKYNRRISAVEKAVCNLKYNEEFAQENNEIIELVNQLSKNYKEELDKTINLPKTNIFGIDNMLEYMYMKAKKDSIELEVHVNCDVKYILDNIITESQFETLLSDHLSDAIIAINYSNSEYRKMKVEFSQKDSIYEIKFYDTGIEFEIDTLLKLGKEQITTHKDSGGTGIGFVTTFETLKGCNGSLIIEEFNDNEENYTKAIIIRFDNNKEYKIKSYRADLINNQNEIIVEKI